MTDNRTMAEMLRAPTEGCAEAIIVPLILAEQFELKHSLINMMTSKQFFGLEKDNQHDHIRCAVTTAMTAMLKKFQSNPPSAQVKAVEEICVTCRGAHPYYQCLVAGSNTFPEFRDNIQGYVSAAAGNYNQGNPGYRPQGVANQMRPPGFAQPNVQNNQNRFGQPQSFNRSTNFNQEQPYQATAQSNQNIHLNELEKIKRMNDTSLSNQTNEIKNMMASLLQMNTAPTSGSGTLPGNTIANPKGKLKAITTRSGLATDGPTVPNPLKFVNQEEDECVEETYTDPDHADELKCKALADLGASINLMPLSVWKKLGLADLIPIRMTLELANHAICTPDEIARDVFVPVGKFTFPADFVVVDYESDPRVPLILGRPFLRTARALIDVHGEEMILCDGDESTTYSANSLLEEFTDELALITYPPDYDDNRMCDIDSDIREIEFLLYQGEDSNFKDSIDQSDLTNLVYLFVDPTPEMFTDEQLLDYSFPSRFDVDDDLPSPDIEDKVFNPGILSHEKSVTIITRVAQEKKLAVSYAFLLFEDFDPPFYELFVFKEVPNSMRLLPFSSENEEKVFKPGIYTSEKVHFCFLSELTHPEMFAEEQPPDYSFPPRFDVYPDDFLEIKSDANFDDDSFDFEGRKSTRLNS
nr:reverse transcriptase domain-containing protein [Tanacetum cinerariifolium]